MRRPWLGSVSEMSNPVSPDTTHHLRWHAGLEQAPAEPLPSISDCTQHGSALADQLTAALNDFLETLERLNHELNGETPSDVIDGVTEIPRDVVYAITEVVRFLREAGDAQAAWKVEAAWSAVLDGDIDNLQEHLNEEYAARER
jgi:hypothetical protein